MKKGCFVYLTLVFLLLLYSESAFSQNISTYEDHFDTVEYPYAPNPNYASSGMLTITSAGTLIVQNLTLTNNAHLVIESGGVLLVKGDLITHNRMTINTGGILIVLGDFIHTGSDKNQGSFNATGGDYSGVYILGEIDADGDKNDITDNGSYPVLDCGAPSDGLTDYIDGCNYGKLPDLIESPVYQSICGQGVSGGDISNHSGSCYEAVELMNVLEADANFRPYSWYYTTNSDWIVNNKPDSISKWNKISDEISKDCIYHGVINSTTYFVRQASKEHGCVVYSNIETVEPSGGSVSEGGVVSGAATVCSGESLSLILSDNIGDVVRWEKSEDDWGTIIPINDTSNTITVLGLDKSTKFRAVVQNGSCNPEISTEINIVVLLSPTPLGIFYN